MEIEYSCKNCSQVICTCNIVCPGCGNLLSAVDKHIGISIKAQVSLEGNVYPLLDKKERKIVNEVWSFLKKVKKNEIMNYETTSGVPSSISITFQFEKKVDNN